MSETMRAWIEVVFNIGYLLVIWGMVVLMLRRQPQASDRKLSRLFIGAFALLAFGDTGHVGFRALAYLSGGADGAMNNLVGLGMFATAVTVTLFYVMMLVIWHTRFNKAYGWFGYLLFAVAAIRLVLLLPEANQWYSSSPPYPWSIYRNIPLMIQGLGVAFLILRDAFAADDHLFKWIGAMILVSYGFYTPVILFANQAPVIGMLMIPKTLAYVAIAFLAYYGLFSKTHNQTQLSNVN